jgi:hypothetical protein
VKDIKHSETVQSGKAKFGRRKWVRFDTTSMLQTQQRQQNQFHTAQSLCACPANGGGASLPCALCVKDIEYSETVQIQKAKFGMRKWVRFDTTSMLQTQQRQ